MGNYKILGCILSFGVLTANCSTPFEPTLKSEPLNEHKVISGTPSLSGYSAKGKNDKSYICLGRGSDATFNQDQSANLSFALVNTGDDKGSESENTGEEEMAGRTPGVLISREILYRVCELYTNLDLDKKEAIDLFKAALGTVSQGWSNESGNTKIVIHDSVTTQQQTSAKFIAPVDATKTDGSKNQKTGATDSSDADATDSSDAGATDSSDAGATDSSDAGATDSSDADATDSSDADATDSSDAGATDSSDAGATDSSDADATDSSDADATDSSDADATDSSDADATDSSDADATDSSTTTATDLIKKLTQ